ncbi:MAG: hypothetical protein CMH81_00700 [Nitrospiraceae bacterium]|nr:hypothetical protein [Nitrospiraceae bacterium]
MERKTVRQRKKLLFVVTEDWYFVSHRLPLAVAAKNKGYDVSVATRVREYGDVIRDAGLRLIPFELSRGGINPLQELWTLLRLIFLYMRERPNIVHHVAMKPVLYGSIAVRVARVPHVVNALTGMGWLFTSGAGAARWLKPIVGWGLTYLLRSGVALVQNHDDAQLLVQLGVPEARIRRIAGSGVNLQSFFPQPEPSGVPVVVLPARLLWDKGVGEFAIAARLLRQQGVAARFVFAGEPDKDNPSSVSGDQIFQWDEEGIIEHLGWVQNMPKLLGESHIVCLPSYREGLPKSLIEAAAAGRPIVTSDAPGCREIVRHGDNGFLVPPRNAEALAEALLQLIRDSSLRQRMGERGRIIAENEFSLEMIIQQTIMLYEEATGRSLEISSRDGMAGSLLYKNRQRSIQYHRGKLRLRALVTGAGGFIGGNLVEALLQMGCSVRVLVRDNSSQRTWPQDVEVAVGKLQDFNSINKAMLGSDTVFHLAGKGHEMFDMEDLDNTYHKVNVDGTRNVIESAVQCGIKRFVFFSSVKTMGEDTSECFSESSTGQPVTRYGKSKLDAEELVIDYGRRAGLHTVCLRLPLVYGAGNAGNLLRMIDAIDRGLFPPFPDVKNLRSMVHVSNVVEAAILAATTARADGQRYIVTDGVPYSTRELYEWICIGLGKQVPVWHIPIGTLKILGLVGDLVGYVQRKRCIFDSLAIDKLIGSAWYSSDRISSELGYNPLVSFSDALPDLISWYRKVRV